MAVDNIHFKSDSDEWETPQWLYDELDAEFGFYFDAAAQENNAKRLEFSSDSLDLDWSALSPVWCNPPYSRGKQKHFLAKAVEEQKKGVTSVFLVPARTDTIAWHKYIWDTRLQKPREGIEVRFLKGRLKFEQNGVAKDAAPFPSAVVVFHG